VFDSGDTIEKIIRDQFPSSWDDTRSDNKGPEPEGVEIGVIDGRTFLFVGLERTSQILAFDITDWDPVSKAINYAGAIFTSGLTAPEGFTFISAADSFDGNAYLAVSYEVGNATALYRLTAVPEPAAIGLFGAALTGLMLARRRAAKPKS
jgi:hypothetical protein